ncbi:CDK9 kinase-activating protein cyclin T [Pelomyxa schiedti]|nr:CDK9 kinase-activating protein cyclin T [Pelomyxa schiedti]
MNTDRGPTAPAPTHPPSDTTSKNRSVQQHTTKYSLAGGTGGFFLAPVSVVVPSVAPASNTTAPSTTTGAARGRGGGAASPSCECEEGEGGGRVTREVEDRSRVTTAFFIKHVASLLQLQQHTTATSLYFFHGFFERHAVGTYDRFLVAAACIYIAGKAEETPRKLRDVLNVSYALLNDQILQIGKEYTELKELLIKTEQEVLRTLSFDLSVEQPYKYLLQFVKAVTFSLDAPLAQLSWNIVNDCLYFPLMTKHAPHVLAAAALNVAALLSNYSLPAFATGHWWEAFGLTTAELEEASCRMLDVYLQVPQIIITAEKDWHSDEFYNKTVLIKTNKV